MKSHRALTASARRTLRPSALGSGLRRRFSTAVEPDSSFEDRPCEGPWRVAKGVNSQYRPDHLEPMRLTNFRDNQADYRNISADHFKPIGEWPEEQLRDAAAKHCVATWGPSKGVAGLPLITHGDGVYLYDSTGAQYLDWTSQAVCTNMGHTVPDEVKQAINGQLDSIPMVYSGLGLVEVRARLSHLLSELCPGDINGFLYTCGGSEANEAAMRMAKRYTGRQKIINQYRSYHGGSTASLTATGDFRRWFGETGTSGFVKTFNPQPFGFRWGENDADRTRLLLLMLEEQIKMEGPESIAAIMVETIVGAGGVLVPPQGYVEGVRALCDHHNILLIMDEVMVGLGRTGKLWCAQHFEGVMPDILTSAKGLTAGILPFGMVGMTQPIKDFFMKEPLGWGATYANHPVGMACAYEVLKYLVQHDLPAKAAAMVENGLYGLFRPPLLHCAPPLTISEEQLRDGFARLDKALNVLDDGYRGGEV